MRACLRCGDYLADSAPSECEFCPACAARPRAPVTIASVYRDTLRVWPSALLAMGLEVVRQALSRLVPWALGITSYMPVQWTYELVESVMFAVNLGVVAAFVARRLDPRAFPTARPLRAGLLLSWRLLPLCLPLGMLMSFELRQALVSDAVSDYVGWFAWGLLGLAVILPLLQRGLIALWLFTPRALLQGEGLLSAMRSSVARWRSPGVLRRVVTALGAWAPSLIAHNLFQFIVLESPESENDQLVRFVLFTVLKPVLALPLLVFALRESEREPTA